MTQYMYKRNVNPIIIWIKINNNNNFKKNRTVGTLKIGQLIKYTYLYIYMLFI